MQKEGFWRSYASPKYMDEEIKSNFKSKSSIQKGSV